MHRPLSARPPRRRRARAALAGAAIAAAAFAGTAAPALADPPVSVSSSALVKDQSGVLGSRKAEVAKAVNEAAAKSGYTLHVVFVNGFQNPSDPDEWGKRTLQKSGSLGAKDVVLIVSTDPSQRQLRVRVPSSSTLDKQDGQAIYQAAREKLSGKQSPGEEDWASAAVAAAQATGGVSGRGSGAGAGSGGLALGGGAALLGGAAVAGGAAYLYSRRKKNRAGVRQPIPAGPGQPAGGPGTPGGGRRSPLEGKSTEELRTLAGQEILVADDAVHAAEQELEFARLQFGEGQVGAMRESIEEAKSAMQEAYSCQQQLDDDIPDTEQQTRSWLIRIVELSGRVKSSLGERAAEFERLRSMEGDIESILAGFEQRSARVRSQLEEAQHLVDTTAASYSRQAVLRIADNVQQARERLDFSDGALAEARSRLSAGDRSQAVVVSRPIDGALSQAEDLLGQITTTSQELTQLDAKLDRALADAKADAAQAEAMGARASTGASDLAAAHAGLVETIRLVEAERGKGHYDPIDLSERLDVARDRVGHALAASSEAGAAREQAARELDRTLERAQRRVDAARDFIETRRGAVGAQARTRLSEAMRLFDESLRFRQSDPVQALDLANQSLSMADQALEIADRDVQGFQPAGYPGGFGGFGGYGGYGGRSSGMGGAILGGVLLGGVLDNIFDHHGGGYGGGGFDGGGGLFGGGGDGGFDIGGGGFDIGGGDFGGGDFGGNF